MLEQVLGVQSIWQVLKARQTLEAYAAGDYSLTPAYCASQSCRCASLSNLLTREGSYFQWREADADVDAQGRDPVLLGEPVISATDRLPVVESQTTPRFGWELQVHVLDVDHQR